VSPGPETPLSAMSHVVAGQRSGESARWLVYWAQHLPVSNESYELAGRSTLPAKPA
jgi:hypothetical protein